MFLTPNHSIIAVLNPSFGTIPRTLDLVKGGQNFPLLHENVQNNHGINTREIVHKRNVLFGNKST